MRKAGRKLWFVVLVAMMGIQHSGAAVFEAKSRRARPRCKRRSLGRRCSG